MAISQNFPEEGPTLNLNFAGSKVLDPRITFIRSSVGTYMDANGLIVTAAADEPRFDHRYVNGEIESLGLLVEESRSNLIEYSTISTVVGWSISGSTVTDNATTAPDGTNTAARIQATGDYVADLSIPVTSGQTYTFSFWVKSVSGSGTWGINWYEVVTGHNRTTVNVTEEWNRVSITFTPTQSVINIYVSDNREGLATISDAYVWGAQLEQGSFKTSLIPTEGSTKTRVHDRAYYENVDQTDWFSKTEGTVVFEHTDVPYNSSTSTGWPAVGFGETAGGGSNPSIQYFITKDYGAGSYLARRFHPNGDSASISTGGTGSGAPASKVGFVYKEDDYALVRNGSLVGTDTSGAVPSAYMLIFGMNAISNTGNNWNTHLKNLQYYPTRLSNTVLQNLTK